MNHILREMMTKNNPSQAASQGQGLRLQPSTMRRALSSFSLYHLPFIIYPLSFIPHPSPFNRRTSSFRLLTFAFCVLTFAFAFSFLPTVLDAQGCAMCYNSASAAKAGAKEALANGVLILLVPPMVFFALITVVVYMYRNRFRETPVVPDGELPIDDFRLPIDGIEDWQSTIGNEPRTTGRPSQWIR